MPQSARLKALRSSRRNPTDHRGESHIKRSDDAQIGFASKEYRDAFNTVLLGQKGKLTTSELRALQVTYDTYGGFMAAPEQMADRFFLAMSDLVFIRDRATKFPLLTAQSLAIPTVESNPADLDWTTEIQIVSEDDELTTGQRLLTPHPTTKLLKLSNKLLRSAPGYAEDIVTDRMAYKSAVTEEKAFLTGSGVRQPLGVFTASAHGINTDRDISCINQGALYESIIDTKYSLKAQYLKNAEWIIHRDVMKVIAKLKDGNGRYLYHEPEEPGMPGMLSGHPVNLSEYAPNTIESGKYVAILGDFSRYVIADSLDLRVNILAELLSATNQTGIIFTRETDGMPGTAEAFSRIKMA